VIDITFLNSTGRRKSCSKRSIGCSNLPKKSKLLSESTELIEFTMPLWFASLAALYGSAVRHPLSSGVKPDLRKLHVGLAHFLPVCFARPSETFFGHCPILAGGFHDNHIPPKKVPSDLYGAVLANDLPQRLA
jgi:hypothetical protein